MSIKPATVHTCLACGSQWVAIHNCSTGQVLSAPNTKTTPPAIRGSRGKFYWPADSEDN